MTHSASAHAAASFSSEVKNELAHIPPGKACCVAAEAFGFFCAAGSLSLAGGAAGGAPRVGLSMTTGNPAVARHVKALAAALCGTDFSVSVSGAAGPAFARTLVLAAPASGGGERFLLAAGVLARGADGRVRVAHRAGAVPPPAAKCCRRAWLRGAFLGAGSVADPNRRYHFELVFSDAAAAADARRVMHTFSDIRAGIYARGGKTVVYLKASEQIKDMLGIMGADRHLLAYEDARMMREIKGVATRLANCDNANVDRAVGAGGRQARAIKKLAKLPGGIGALPPKLREAAAARLENPDASLAELGQMFDPPVGKAAAAERYARLERMAR